MHLNNLFFDRKGDGGKERGEGGERKEGNRLVIFYKLLQFLIALQTIELQRPMALESSQIRGYRYLSKLSAPRLLRNLRDLRYMYTSFLMRECFVCKCIKFVESTRNSRQSVLPPKNYPKCVTPAETELLDLFKSFSTCNVSGRRWHSMILAGNSRFSCQ